MTPNDVPVRLTHMWRRDGDQVVVISDANFNLIRYEFNRVGRRVWELMDGKRSLQDIVNVLAVESPDVSPQLISSGVEDFLHQLQSEWLMVTREELSEYE